MKKLILLIALLSLPATGFAEKSKSRKASRSSYTSLKKVKKKRSGWAINPIFGAVSTNYSFSGSRPVDIFEVESAAGTGFTGGVNVDFPYGTRYITLSSGLIYSRNVTEYRFVINNRDFQGTYRAKNELERLNIPLHVSWFPFKKRNGFFLKAGLQGSYLLGGQESYSTSGQIRNDNNELNAFF